MEVAMPSFVVWVDADSRLGEVWELLLDGFGLAPKTRMSWSKLGLCQVGQGLVE